MPLSWIIQPIPHSKNICCVKLLSLFYVVGDYCGSYSISDSTLTFSLVYEDNETRQWKLLQSTVCACQFPNCLCTLNCKIPINNQCLLFHDTVRRQLKNPKSSLSLVYLYVGSHCALIKLRFNYLSFSIAFSSSASMYFV